MLAMTSHLPNTATTPTAPAWRRGLGVLALLAACGFAGLLGVRTLVSPDLGYHLAYGESFWDAGEIVDSSPMVYTLHAPAPDGWGELPPGCWFDTDGVFRFPNANWLSQVVMSACWRAGGVTGLCVLQAALAGGIFALGVVTMLRLGVPAGLAAAAVLLIALTSYERLSLRPEVFGYLLLSGELCVLATCRPSWRSAMILVLLQLLMVNLHSYFLLGLALAGAFWLEALLRSIWARRTPHPPTGEDRRRLAFRSIAMAGMLAACLVNPWTWRLAVLPVQTLLFMRAHNVAGGGTGPGGHPWSYIGEFFRPLADVSFAQTPATKAYMALLAIAAVAWLVCLARRRWAWALILLAMAAVSLSMRRNIAPAAIIIGPLAAAALWDWPLSRLGAGFRKYLSPLASGAIVLAGILLSVSVATQGFYHSQRSPVRMGCGLSDLALPLDAGRWLDANLPAARIWTDYNSSSNLHYFTTPHRPVPILTNTWAYPPGVMQEVLRVGAGSTPFAPLQSRDAIGAVVLRIDRSTAPLARTLAGGDGGWALVHLAGTHAVFAPRKALPAGTGPLSEDTLDTAGYIARLTAMDPCADYALHAGGVALYDLEWYSAAVEVFRAAAAANPGYYKSRMMVGVSLAQRARRRAGDSRALADLQQARQEFLQALQIAPHAADAKTNLNLVQRDIQLLQQ